MSQSMSKLVDDFIRRDVSADAPLDTGDIVVPTLRELNKIRRLFPRIELSTQLRVQAIVKGGYSRQCIMVIDRPGGTPIGLWRSMVKRLPNDARVADVWAKASIAEFIP